MREFADHEERQAWIALQSGAMAGLGYASQASQQAAKAFAAYRARRVAGEVDPAAWAALCAGALAGLTGNAVQAIKQADVAMAEVGGLLTLGAHPSDETYVERHFELRERRASRERQLEVEAEELKRAEAAQVEIEQVADFEGVIGGPSAEHLQQFAEIVGDAEVEVHRPTIDDVAYLHQTAWVVFLGCSLPVGEEVDAEIGKIVERWSTAAEYAADPQAVKAMTGHVGHLGRGRRWDPGAKARSLLQLARAWVDATSSAGGNKPEHSMLGAEAFSKLAGVDARIATGYRMMVLGDLPDERPEDGRLAAAWDRMRAERGLSSRVDSQVDAGASV